MAGNDWITIIVKYQDNWLAKIMYRPHQAVAMDNIYVDTHNHHQMCIHFTLMINQQFGLLEAGHPKSKQ